MIRPFDGVAWDVDGTLVDSEPLHLRCLVQVCGDLGLDLTGEPDDRFLGIHIHDVWSALAPDLPDGLDRSDFLARIDDAYAAGVAGLRPMPGAVEVVEALARGGIAQVAVSNSGRLVVDANLSALGITHRFLATISLDDVTSGKPDPEPFARGATALGLPPSRILAIEDSPTGAASATAAGLPVVILGGGGPTGIRSLMDVLNMVLPER